MLESAMALVFMIAINVVQFGNGIEIIDGPAACSGNVDCIINCSDCNDDDLFCPDSYNCTVNCLDDTSCLDAYISWPTTSGLGTLNCDGLGACHGVNFPIPDPNTNLLITCNDEQECKDATIFCPKSANCTVQCIGTESCKDTLIVWPTDSSTTSNITCNGLDSCVTASKLPTYIFAPNNEDYILQCFTSMCESYVVYCPFNYSCTIRCDGDYACRNMQIIWVDTQNHNIRCNEAYDGPCYGVRTISKYKNSALDVNCAKVGYNLDSNPCAKAVIDCPLNAACTIQCSGTDSCRYTEINPGFGELNILCSGTRSCKSIITASTLDCSSSGNACSYSTINCIHHRNCTIKCSSCEGVTIYGAINHRVSVTCYRCNGAVIYGPINNTLSVLCSGSNACNGTIIYAPTNNTLSITCSGSNACDGTIIYGQHASSLYITCSVGKDTCSSISLWIPPRNSITLKQNAIIYDTDDNGLTGTLNVYAINGFLDLLFVNYTELQTAQHDGFMHCGQNYSIQCTLDTNEWQCGPENDHCDNPLGTPLLPLTTSTSLYISTSNQLDISLIIAICAGILIMFIIALFICLRKKK
eukprot:302671_1